MLYTFGLICGKGLGEGEKDHSKVLRAYWLFLLLNKWFPWMDQEALDKLQFILFTMPRKSGPACPYL